MGYTEIIFRPQKFTKKVRKSLYVLLDSLLLGYISIIMFILMFFAEAQEIKQWCDVLGVLALHAEVVEWFCHVGLLPELADEDCAAAEMQASSLGVPRIPYPAKTLMEAYEKRYDCLYAIELYDHISVYY